MVWWTVMVQHKVVYNQVVQSLKLNPLDIDLAKYYTLMTVTTYTVVFVFGN